MAWRSNRVHRLSLLMQLGRHLGQGSAGLCMRHIATAVLDSFDTVTATGSA